MITSNIDERDHPFILGSTNPDLAPLVELLASAERKGLSGTELQAVEDKWTKESNLALYPDTIAKYLTKKGISESEIKSFVEEAHKLSHHAVTLLAQERFKISKSEMPFWSWDTPRTREGFYRYQGGTKCAIARAVAYADYSDLGWMETKSPIFKQAKEFAEGVHKHKPHYWLAYNLS